VSRLERASERYRKHHLRTRSREFIYAGEERAELFARYVGGPGQRVLDIGCRYGTLTSKYVVGNDVIGIDVDRHALEAAAELGIETIWADAEEPLPFDDESLDVVVAGELLEHMRDPEALVTEAHRVLRPGGTLVGSVPNAFRLKNRLRFLAGRQPERDPTHLHMFTPRDVRQLLGRFNDVHLYFVASRFLRLHKRLFANDIVFAARRPLLRPHS
jgi:SAM-dependent methyltransferase